MLRFTLSYSGISLRNSVIMGFYRRDFLILRCQTKKLRIMKQFITIADTNGKSWCINTDAIIINKSILSYIIKPACADRIVANSTLCRTARYPR